MKFFGRLREDWKERDKLFKRLRENEEDMKKLSELKKIRYILARINAQRQSEFCLTLSTILFCMWAIILMMATIFVSLPLCVLVLVLGGCSLYKRFRHDTKGEIKRVKSLLAVRKSLMEEL